MAVGTTNFRVNSVLYSDVRTAAHATTGPSGKPVQRTVTRSVYVTVDTSCTKITATLAAAVMKKNVRRTVPQCRGHQLSPQ